MYTNIRNMIFVEFNKCSRNYGRIMDNKTKIKSKSSKTNGRL